MKFDLFDLYKTMGCVSIRLFYKNGQIIYQGHFDKVPANLAHIDVLKISYNQESNIVDIKIDLQENTIKNVFISDLDIDIIERKNNNE